MFQYFILKAANVNNSGVIINDTMITALIGVGGTLVGTLLGWVLNAKSYKIGKTTINATLTPYTIIPEISMFKNNNKRLVNEELRPKYQMECVAFNSRQIPIILSDFRIEMKKSRYAQPERLSVLEPITNYVDVGNGKFALNGKLKRQLIQPRTLHEFSFLIDYANNDIMNSRLELVAYNEKHKQQRFLIYDGTKRNLK